MQTVLSVGDRMDRPVHPLELACLSQRLLYSSYRFKPIDRALASGPNQQRLSKDGFHEP
jgi:hypothetical protein